MSMPVSSVDGAPVWLLEDGDGLFGAHSHREKDLFAEVFAGVFVEHDEVVIVVNLKNLGGIAHTQGVAFALFHINFNTHTSILAC
jgi:hypothetical protein